MSVYLQSLLTACLHEDYLLIQYFSVHMRQVCPVLARFPNLATSRCASAAGEAGNA